MLAVCWVFAVEIKTGCDPYERINEHFGRSTGEQTLLTGPK